MLKNFKIRNRLLLGFGVVLLLLLAVSVFAVFQMHFIAGFTQDLYDHPFTVSNAVRAAETNMIKMHRSMKDVTLAQDSNQLEAAVTEVDRLERLVFDHLEKARDFFLGEKTDLDKLRDNFAAWKTVRDEVIRLTRQKQTVEAAAITKGKGADYIEQLSDSLKGFVEFAEKKAATFLNSAREGESRAYVIVSICVLIALVTAIIIALIITNSITRPVNAAVAMAEKLSRGDLNIHEQTYAEDEMGRMLEAMKNMAKNLRQQIGQLVDGIRVLASSASEISSTTAQFASTTQEVSTSVNEVVVSMKEVKQTTELSNEKAKEMAQRARNVVQISNSGEQAVQQTIAAINTIQEQMISIADSVVGLSDQSQSIGEIIAAVDDVADQSRLLAVNASIEAVKAGEMGIGFTVVADEIKNLAQQSKQSTSQVRNILTDIQKATSASVMATEKGSKAVENGVNQATLTGGAIRTLGESVNQSSQAAVQIEATSRQQVAGIEQVFSAMESIGSAIGQNADGARQLENSARDLEALGQKLKSIVENYNL